MENQDDKRLLKILEKGFVLYQKDGIIYSIPIPAYGSILLKSQDGQIVFEEVTTGRKL